MISELLRTRSVQSIDDVGATFSVRKRFQQRNKQQDGPESDGNGYETTKFQTTMNNLKKIRTTIKSETTIEHIYQIFLRKNQLEEAESKRHYWCLICNSRIPVPRDMRKTETGCFRVYICRSDDGKPCMERKSGKWEKRWLVLMSKQADPLEEITEKLYQTMITEKSDDKNKENEARNFIDEEGDEEMTANDNDDAFWTPAAMPPRPKILSNSKASNDDDAFGTPVAMSNGRVTCPRSPLVNSKRFFKRLKRVADYYADNQRPIRTDSEDNKRVCEFKIAC